MFIFERIKTTHLALASIVFVLIPFLTWYSTWFGRPLTDQQIAEKLHDDKARNVQHALWKIAERIQHGDPNVRQFYPRVTELASNPLPEVRVNVAWVMGQDNHAEAFHVALLHMLADNDPLVRRNAALALVRFHDAAGRPEIASMLRPYSVLAPHAGTLSYRLKVGDSVGRGTMLAHLGEDELRSPVPGFFESMLIRDGSPAAAGAPLLTISPSEDQVWEALRALYLIGTAEELGDINGYARGMRDMSPRVQQQAELTAAAIRKR
jgi:biotin carboxyl carrier protein